MAQIYKRGGIYWARARRKTREYRISLKTDNRAVAERRFAEWLQDLNATSWGEKLPRSFEQAAELFIREHLTTLKPSSAKRYGVSLKNLALHFGGKRLHEISTSTLSEYETRRRAEGVTSSTIRRDFACLSSMLATAIDREWIEDNANIVPGYLRRRAKRGLKEAPPRTRYLTEEEERRLLEQATPAVRDAIILAIDTGLRSDELFGLTWPQVDLSRGVIATTTRTKSGKARMVPLPQRSRTIAGTLVRHLGVPFVLVNPDTRTRYVHMLQGLRGAARRAGIKDLRWHDLRRTAGCRWLQRDGLSMEQVSTLLGHSSSQITGSRYAFIDSQRVAENIGAAVNE